MGIGLRSSPRTASASAIQCVHICVSRLENYPQVAEHSFSVIHKIESVQALQRRGEGGRTFPPSVS